jgi:hypothetical protein
MLGLIFTTLFAVIISYWLVKLVLTCFSKERQLEIMEMVALHQGIVSLAIITLGLLSFFYFDIKPILLIPVLVFMIGLFGNLYEYTDDLKEQYFKYLWLVLLLMFATLCYTIMLSFISILFLGLSK